MGLDLIACAFGRHDFGAILHDDMLDRWIRICRRCGAVEMVDAPRDEHGMNYSPHEWLEIQNERSAEELGELIDKYKKEHE